MNKGYGTFCPVAKAAEVLAERWTLLLMRDLLLGSRHFNDFRRALPPMSPGLITKRLNTLIAHGIVQRVPDRDPRHRWQYQLTPAGEALRPIVKAIGEWGQRWVRSDLNPADLDAGALMWYVHRHFRPDRRPASRVVMHVELSDQKLRHWWLVLDGDEVELCVDDPGFDVDIELCATLLTLTRVYIGDLDFADARARGLLRVRGPDALTRDMHSWFARSAFADVNPRPVPATAERAARIARPIVRAIALRSSSYQSTPLAIAAQTSHWSGASGTVPKARFRKPRFTTASCSSTEPAIAAHSQRFTNRCRNALIDSERELKQLNSCAKTSVVNAAVRALPSSCEPSISPPGR